MIESVSRRAFSSSSGTYNVRASELARERKLNIFNVTVQLLDDTQHTFQIEVSVTLAGNRHLFGAKYLRYVCRQYLFSQARENIPTAG